MKYSQFPVLQKTETFCCESRSLVFLESWISLVVSTCLKICASQIGSFFQGSGVKIKKKKNETTTQWIHGSSEKDQPLCLVAYTSGEGICLLSAWCPTGSNPLPYCSFAGHLVWKMVIHFSFAHHEAQPSCFSIMCVYRITISLSLTCVPPPKQRCQMSRTLHLL